LREWRVLAQTSESMNGSKWVVSRRSALNQIAITKQTVSNRPICDRSY
jgi:hypothetical protein